jgi:D-sedoheptulose 7-phosphate isomerase
MPKEYAKKYLSELKKSLDSMPLDKIEEIVEVLKAAYKNGKRVYSLGNGGSAATASHFVCDFAKGTSVKGKKKFKVIGLTDNVPMMTAMGNDVSYDDIFLAQLEPLLEKDDVVVVFTGSGNSKNVLKAVEYANSVGAKTVALTGFDGGKVKNMAKHVLIAPSHNMERIEDMHLIIEHLMHLYFYEGISEGRIS